MDSASRRRARWRLKLTEEECGVHRTGALYGQFETLEQQKETASLGMWIFLVTEVMFFGGIMLAYTLNRHVYLPRVRAGQQHAQHAAGYAQHRRPAGQQLHDGHGRMGRASRQEEP